MLCAKHRDYPDAEETFQVDNRASQSCFSAFAGHI
jgi:hypothetical protein